MNFHDDVIIRYLVTGFDMHFDDFTFMQTFTQLREAIFKIRCFVRCWSSWCSWRLSSRSFSSSTLLIRHVTFCFDNSHYFTDTAYLTVFSQNFQYSTVYWARHLNYRLVILNFHYDIIIRYFVAGFDMHFDDFTFMQTFT
ncbi:hypothetical protein D3C81_1840630 [compost metagenome]